MMFTPRALYRRVVISLVAACLLAAGAVVGAIVILHKMGLL